MLWCVSGYQIQRNPITGGARLLPPSGESSGCSLLSSAFALIRYKEKTIIFFDAGINQWNISCSNCPLDFVLKVKTVSQETGQQTLFLITLRSEVDNFLFVLSLPTVPCCPVLPSHLNLCHLSEVQQQQERRPGRPGQHPQPPQDHQTL